MQRKVKLPIEKIFLQKKYYRMLLYNSKKVTLES
jgi:hypothetical protein